VLATPPGRCQPAPGAFCWGLDATARFARNEGSPADRPDPRSRGRESGRHPSLRHQPVATDSNREAVRSSPPCKGDRVGPQELRGRDPFLDRVMPSVANTSSKLAGKSRWMAWMGFSAPTGLSDAHCTASETGTQVDTLLGCAREDFEEAPRS
jgi:hypothetical protein